MTHRHWPSLVLLRPDAVAIGSVCLFPRTLPVPVGLGGTRSPHSCAPTHIHTHTCVHIHPCTCAGIHTCAHTLTHACMGRENTHGVVEKSALCSAGILKLGLGKDQAPSKLTNELPKLPGWCWILPSPICFLDLLGSASLNPIPLPQGPAPQGPLWPPRTCACAQGTCSLCSSPMCPPPGIGSQGQKASGGVKL